MRRILNKGSVIRLGAFVPQFLNACGRQHYESRRGAWINMTNVETARQAASPMPAVPRETGRNPKDSGPLVCGKSLDA
jgi:hypothetical protein